MNKIDELFQRKVRLLWQSFRLEMMSEIEVYLVNACMPAGTTLGISLKRDERSNFADISASNKLETFFNISAINLN